MRHIFHKWGPWINDSRVRQVKFCQNRACNMRKSRYIW